MKPAPRWMFLASLLVIILTLIVFSPSQSGDVFAQEFDIITATASPADAVYVVAQAIASPTRTPTPINVGNFVWNDLNGNGIYNAGEPGLAGVVVQLWNGAKNDLIASTTTNASGIYALVAPTPGEYRVRVLLPSLLDQFSPKDAGADTTDSDINPSGVNSGFTDIYTFASNLISITSIDAGIRKYATPTPTRTPTPINVGNFVWDDLDDDGRQDAGEPGLAGVTVQLWNAAKTQLIGQTTTNASGIYTLVAPTPGDYRVRVLLPNPAMDAFTVKDNAAAGDLLDSDINPSGTNSGFTDVYTFASNLISITSIDAGINRYMTPTPTRTPTPINVGNFIWRDLNGNGLQDAGEPGLAGVTVQLWNGAKTNLIASTTTNASGIYTLVAPTPGDYRVRVLTFLPGDLFSPKNSGDDLLDSDVNPSGPDVGFTDVYTFGSNLISITSIDIGISYLQPTATPTPTQSPPGAAPSLNYRRLSYVVLTWNTVTWATGYAVQLDNNADFSSPEYNNTTLGPNARSVFVFLPVVDAVYYWRAGSKRADGTIVWSAAQSVRVDLP